LEAYTGNLYCSFAAGLAAFLEIAALSEFVDCSVAVVDSCSFDASSEDSDLRFVGRLAEIRHAFADCLTDFGHFAAVVEQ
jgi:hypothetical protein